MHLGNHEHVSIWHRSAHSSDFCDLLEKVRRSVECSCLQVTCVGHKANWDHLICFTTVSTSQANGDCCSLGCRAGMGQINSISHSVMPSGKEKEVQEGYTALIACLLYSLQTFYTQPVHLLAKLCPLWPMPALDTLKWPCFDQLLFSLWDGPLQPTFRLSG